MDHPKNPFFVWSWISRVHNFGDVTSPQDVLDVPNSNSLATFLDGGAIGAQKKMVAAGPVFLSFSPAAALFGLRKFGSKKIRDDEGNGQLFCSDFLSFCDVSIFGKINQ